MTKGRDQKGRPFWRNTKTANNCPKLKPGLGLILSVKTQLKMGMMTHTCHPSTWKTETRGSWEFLGHIARYCLKKKKRIPKKQLAFRL